MQRMAISDLVMGGHSFLQDTSSPETRFAEWISICATHLWRASFACIPVPVNAGIFRHLCVSCAKSLNCLDNGSSRLDGQRHDLALWKTLYAASWAVFVREI